jgi:hypothetical protein
MPAFRLCVVLAVAIGACIAAESAFAQKKEKPKIEWEDWEGQGTVVGIRGNALGMMLRGEQWVGVVAPLAKVSVTGMADKDVLRPGMVVRLNAEFDRKSNATIEPVKELEIVTPRPGDRTGIINEDEIGGKSKGLPPPTLKLQIFDAISNVKDNTLTFKRYKVELAPDVSIKVDVSSAAVLSQGDEVTKVKGKRIKGTKGQLMIGELEAKLMKPLSAPKRRVPQSTASRSAGKGAAQGELFNVAGDEATGKKSAAKEEEKDEKDGGKKDSEKKDGEKKDGKE